MSTKIKLDYKKLALELRNLKLIKIDLRRKFTPAIKSKLTKLAKKTLLPANVQRIYKDYFKTLNKDKLIKKRDLRKKFNYYDRAVYEQFPKKIKTITKYRDDFVLRKVNKQTLALFKDNGYLTSKSSVYIPKNNYQKIYITRFMSEVAVIREIRSKNGKRVIKKQMDIIIKPGTIFQLLNKLENEYPNGLPKGWFLTARIGTNSPFSWRFTSDQGLLIGLQGSGQQLDMAGIDNLSLVIFLK